MTDLSIITLSRNLDYFKRLAGALEWAQDLTAQCILVNNANSMALTAEALRHGWMVVEPGYNTTFAEGNNMAAKAADGHWLLLLNDDVIPTPEFLDKLWARRLEANVLGALLLHQDGTVNHAGTRMNFRGQTDHLGRGDAREIWEEDAAAAVPSVTFAAALVNVNLYRELGGLDERYQYGWEDTDFCLRAMRAGATIRCARDAVATHDECGTRPRGGAADMDNMRLFLQTWQGDIPKLLTEYAWRLNRAGEQVEGIG